MQYNDGHGWSNELDAGPSTSFDVPVPHNGAPAFRFRVKGCNGVKVGGRSDGCGDWSAVSPPKQADTIPGPVTHLTAAIPPGPGSPGPTGSLKLTWTPPADTSSPVGFVYTITWNGGKKTVSGRASTEALLTDLPNDTPLNFTVWTQNQASNGPGAPQPVPGEAAGKPSDPTWPLETALPPAFEATNVAGSSQRAVTVHWNGVDSNGPKPTHYTVTRTGASTPVCPDVTETNCVDPNNIQNDGTRYVYSVVAWNSAGVDAARRSDFSSSVVAGPPMQASAQPDGISGLSAAPTGGDQQAKLTFDLGASHGTTSIVKCSVTVAGSTAHDCTPAQWTFDTSAHGQVSETVSGLTNGSQATFSLTACNDTTTAQHDVYSGNPCRQAATTVSATPYGDFAAPQVTLTHVGNLMTWTVVGNANGRDVNVHLTDQQHALDTTLAQPVGPMNYSGSSTFTLPPDTTDVVTAAVTDTGSSPSQRPGKTGTSNPEKTDPLALSAGPRCGSPSSTSVTCSWGAAPDPGSVTYHVSWPGHSDTTTGLSYQMNGLPQDGAGGQNFSVYATDNTGAGHTSAALSTTFTDPVNPTPPAPTVSGLAVVNGGCNCGVGPKPQVGVAFDVTYPAGSSGGSCHYTRDGAELVSPLPCGQNGRASHQFYGQPTGVHTYCGFIRMPAGNDSNVACKAITVT